MVTPEQSTIARNLRTAGVAALQVARMARRARTPDAWIGVTHDLDRITRAIEAAADQAAEEAKR